MFSLKRPGAAVALLLFSTSAALADRIDGSWCFASSNFEIEGPKIRTPGGAQLTGNYTRHGFSYVVPPSEPGAGAEIVMRLINDEMLELLRPGGTTAEVWRRCRVTS